jgi:hypothetical protein
MVVLTACDRTTEPHSGLTPPVALEAEGLADPDNVTSARVVVVATPGDSVRVLYWSTGQPVQSTPYYLVGSGPDTIDVLGVRAAENYDFKIEAQRNGMMSSSTPATFQTADLPATLATAQMEHINGASPSRMALTTVAGPSGESYAVAFDTSGTIVWYHDFTSYGQILSNVVKQPNGNITAAIGTSAGWQASDCYYVEIDPDGREVAQYHPPSGYYMDGHDLLLTGDGPTKRAHFFTYTIKTLDLTSIGGLSSVQTAGHQIMRMTPSGTVEFIWDAWDHIGLDEWISDTDLKATRNETDFDHPNSLTFDAKGNYVVSWRNLSQIMSIDPNTGAVLWRVGGAKGDYTFLDDPLGGFSKQHSVKVLANGDLLLFDNGTDHSPSESRGVEYQLDHNAKTARMVWQYRHDPALFATYVGWIERLPNGDTWVAFSFFGRVVEADSKGQVVWEGQLRVNDADVEAYRIVPIASVY